MTKATGFFGDYTDGGSGEQSSSFYGTDKEYSEAAALSAQSASNSATAASASATSAAASAAATASDASEVAADAAAAEAAKLAAQAAQAAAELAETGAETAETNAETAETNAASSASAASTSATNAANSASSAATSASNASTSASAAATSATDASTSASSAATSATSAATSAGTATTQAAAAAASATSASNSATAAASSASAASTSATNAATSETNAATSASNASTSETNASASETAAAGSATSASTSASNAATSATSASNSASAASTSATNAAASETNAATSETNAAASASAASTSATNAAASESAAATSATNASTAQTAAEAAQAAAEAAEAGVAADAAAAATSESNAASSATAAASSASSASTSASNAATSATNAAASETAAAGSASAASASADAALAALDNFDDRYLGQKASAPTVDNDGDPLVTGALYFDTVDDAMKVWDGTQWLNAYASLSGALIAANNLSDLTNAATARTNLGLGTAATTDSTAYATAAQGALADSALQSGDNISELTNNSGYITGNQTITLSGDVSGSGTTSIVVTVADDSHNHIISNVDGLQAALDGKVDDSQVLTNVPLGAVFTDTTYSVGNGGLTEINFTSALNSKLAGIEAGATADQTASEILTAIKTVDGSGSGLDADLLDGQQGTYYAAASSLSNYLPLTGGTLSGALDVTGIVTADGLTVDGGNVLFKGGDISFYEDTGTTAKFFWDASAESLGIGTSSPSSAYGVDSTKGIRITSTVPAVTLEESDASSHQWQLGSYGGNFSIRDVTHASYPFTVAEGGNVGIGTSTPSGALDIGGQHVLNDNYDAVGASFTRNGTYGSVLSLGRQGVSSGVTLDYPTDNTFALSTVGTERMRITSSGRVGIGRQPTSHILEAAGEIKLTSLGANQGIDAYNTSSAQWGIKSVSATAAGVSFEVSGTERARIDSSGNVGIGTASPSEKLNVSGNILATGNITAYSDERLKSDIETLDGSKVYQMRGVSYTKDGQASSGVIAQELQKVAPELVSESGKYLSVAYGNLVGYLIEAVKELKAEVEALKGEK